MDTHRLNELLELLQPQWQKEPKMHLCQFLGKLAKEAGYEGSLENLTDDMLIYHLKLRGMDKTAMIPGLQKDYEEDFKTAILKARGIIKDD